MAIEIFYPESEFLVTCRRRKHVLVIGFLIPLSALTIDLLTCLLLEFRSWDLCAFILLHNQRLNRSIVYARVVYLFRALCMCCGIKLLLAACCFLIMVPDLPGRAPITRAPHVEIVVEEIAVACVELCRCCWSFNAAERALCMAC